MSSPAPTTAAARPTPSRLYRGVLLEPDGRWAAYYVSQGDGGDDGGGEGEGRLIGHFEKEVRAALAHDRVALVLGGGAAGLNFPPAFSPMERLFLRRRCTAEFVLRAVLDETYDFEFEGFLYEEFDAYWCGEAGEETARAVAGFAARLGKEWVRLADSEAAATRRFVMGHINPVLCSSWVALFHAGDPNRAYFTCEEAHEWEAAAARRRRASEAAAAAAAAAEAEAAAAAAAAQKQVEMPAPASADEPASDHPERGKKQRPAAASSSVRAQWWRSSSSTPMRSMERWLRRACFFGEPTEQQMPLLDKPM
ncbi:hypothetical protein ACP4OV_024491 [Aristida adscensionis]